MRDERATHVAIKTFASGPGEDYETETGKWQDEAEETTLGV
jgi:hypothetical protein